MFTLKLIKMECLNMYKSYQQRLKTFQNWTSEFPYSTLASAKFVYSGAEDAVECLICQVHLAGQRQSVVRSLEIESGLLFFQI